MTPIRRHTWLDQWESRNRRYLQSGGVVTIESFIHETVFPAGLFVLMAKVISLPTEVLFITITVEGENRFYEAGGFVKTRIRVRFCDKRFN